MNGQQPVMPMKPPAPNLKELNQQVQTGQQLLMNMQQIFNNFGGTR